MSQSREVWLPPQQRLAKEEEHVTSSLGTGTEPRHIIKIEPLPSYMTTFDTVGQVLVA